MRVCVFFTGTMGGQPQQQLTRTSLPTEQRPPSHPPQPPAVQQQAPPPAPAAPPMAPPAPAPRK